MTKLRYVGAHDEVIVPAAGDLHVERGAIADFPADLAASLLEQPANWQAASKPYKPPEDDNPEDEE